MAYRRRKKGFFSLFGIGGRGRRSRFSFPFSSGGFDLSSETKQGIITIFLFLLAALSLLGLFDLAGEFGRIVVNILSLLFGGLKWIFPVMALVFGYFLLRSEKYSVKTINSLGGIFLVLGLTAFWHILSFDLSEMTGAAARGLGGGYVGLALAWPLIKLMGFWGAFSVAVALLLIGTLLVFETSLYGLMWPVKLFKFFAIKIKDLFVLMQQQIVSKRGDSSDEYEEDDDDSDLDEVDEEDAESEEDDYDAQSFQSKAIKTEKSKEDGHATDDIAKPKKFGRKIELPLDLLTGRSNKPTSGDIKSNQEIISKTLANFGINVEMSEVNIGPTVTQYAFRPADGIKLSRITNLNSDLALALAAHPIRIEAPIPGRSLVGVEIPNQLAAKVTMNDLLSSKEFKTRDSNLLLSLGKDVSGKSYFGNLDKMPHLLIAGATGSGKSVCINSLIVSLLYQNSPDDLKFIMVDPKRVELPTYNGIPYLLTPVITDVKKTINALKWTVTEMERRFELLSKVGKRNIAAFNVSAKDKLPYIVFVIDELADLMATAASDVEAGIVRLAQMARAVGIHLVLATQRPSVEVITGLIKANIPARIAFSVASLIDSRTILDNSGAEKLVGRGDMLYLGPEVSKPKRLQGVFLSDREIKNVVDYIKDQGSADYVEGVVDKQSAGGLAAGGFSDDGGDSLLSEAKEVIIQSGKASASLLQRRLKVGYARAARILDLLEDQGIVGPADGAKPREVFLDRLGGPDPVEFAAREHDLEGELKSVEDEDESDQEEDIEEEENTGEYIENDDSSELLEEDDEEKEEGEEEADDDSDEVPVFKELNDDGEEETDEKKKKDKQKKNVATFGEDEWT